jgi:hypothetical protein
MRPLHAFTQGWTHFMGQETGTTVSWGARVKSNGMLLNAQPLACQGRGWGWGGGVVLMCSHCQFLTMADFKLPMVTI